MTFPRKTLVCLAVFFLLFSLSSCGNHTPTEPATEPPLTAEQVYTSVAEAMADAQATRMKMALSYQLSMTMGEGDSAVTTDAGMDLVMDTIACNEPFGSYSMVDIVTDTGIFSLSYKLEVYLVEEEDSVVAYTQMFDTWTKTDYGMTVSDFLTSGLMTEVSTQSVWSGTTPEDLTLEERTGSLNGKKVYILHGSIPALDLGDAFSNLGVSDPSVLESLSLPVTYYVDTETFLILRMEAGFAFLADVLDDILVQSVDTVMEGASLELTIPDVVYELEYGTPQIPSVPQKAYDYIASHSGDETPNPSDANEPLVLRCGEEALELRCPLGFTGEFTSDSNISMHDEGYNLVGDYYYFKNLTEDEVINLANINANFLDSLDLLEFQGEGPEIPGYDTWVVIGEDQSYYYAWRQAGDGWLLVQVYDFSGTDDARILLPQFVGCLFPYSE